MLLSPNCGCQYRFPPLWYVRKEATPEFDSGACVVRPMAAVFSKHSIMHYVLLFCLLMQLQPPALLPIACLSWAYLTILLKIQPNPSPTDLKVQEQLQFVP